MPNTIFAVVLLADVEQSSELAQRLTQTGIEVTIVTGSDELYRLINDRPIDLLIVEDRLPGFLSGMEILERLHSESQLRPGCMLLSARPEEWAARAARLGVKHVLRRDSSLDVLVALARSVAECSLHAQLQTLPEARRLANQFDAIPPLPPLGKKLYGCLTGDDCVADELSAAVASDPQTVAGLLRITNSAALGLRCKVTSAGEAVNLLGSRRAAGYALKTILINSQSAVAANVPRDICTWFRQRAVLTGCVASAFAGRLEKLPADVAYVQGLLLDVGILAMAQAYTRRYQRIFETVQRVGPLRLEVLEQREFHLNHAHVSAAILERWGLPQSFVSLCLQHYTCSSQAQLTPLDERALRVLRIGAAAATAVLKPMHQPGQHLSDLVREYGPEMAEVCEGAMNEAIAGTLEASRLYAVAVPERSRMNQLLKLQLNAQPEIDVEITIDGERTYDIEHFDRTSPESNTNQVEPKLLVIDDEFQYVRLIEDYLSPVGLQIVSGRTVEDALRLAPDVQAIICDVHLGNDDGRNVARRLRKSGCTAPIILMSVDRTRRTIEGCVGSGVADYLIKPFSPAMLLSKLRKHTGLALARR